MKNKKTLNLNIIIISRQRIIYSPPTRHFNSILFIQNKQICFLSYFQEEVLSRLVENKM